VVEVQLEAMVLVLQVGKQPVRDPEFATNVLLQAYRRVQGNMQLLADILQKQKLSLDLEQLIADDLAQEMQDLIELHLQKSAAENVQQEKCALEESLRMIYSGIITFPYVCQEHVPDHVQQC
jgi:hypothetical protein